MIQFLLAASFGPSAGWEVTPVWRFNFSVVSGITMCALAYKLTEFISIRCYNNAYDKLKVAQKVEWNNRGISTIHAIFAASVSFYLLVMSDLFHESKDSTMMINRTNTLSNTSLGISVGYFLTDMAMLLWCYPALGGAEYLVHHGLSLFSLLAALILGEAQFYILMVLFTEITTPMVNLRWYLDVAGMKSSKAYLYNGILLFLGWLIARVVLFIFFFGHIFVNFDEVKQMSPVGLRSLLTIPPLLAILNVFWFWKILKGMMKTLSKARRRD